MATTNVGNLHVKLMMTDRQFQAASNRVRNTNRQTGASLNRLSSGGMANANRSLLELSRGFEDFAVVYGTTGFAGGMRAAANNLSQFAMIAGGPALGAVAGLTVAGISLWQAYKNGADKATDALKNYKAELGRLKSEYDNLAKQRQNKNALALALGITSDRVVLKQDFEEARKRLDELLLRQKKVTAAQQAAISRRDVHAPRTFMGIPNRLSNPMFDEADREVKNLERQSKILAGIIEQEEKRYATIKQAYELDRNRRDLLERQQQVDAKMKKSQEYFDRQKELEQGKIDEQAGISEGKRIAKESRMQRRLAVQKRKFETMEDRKRELDMKLKQRDRLRERMKDSRRITELPSGADFFSAEAQNRLSRIQAGRFQGDNTEAKQLKELEKINREIRDLKNSIKPVKPVNL